MTLAHPAPVALLAPGSASCFGAALLDDGNRLTGVMRRLGIVQKGDPVLTDRDQRGFDLPREAAAADRLMRRLVAMADRVETRYPFKHGMGLAAPQLGVPRRLALVRTEPFGPPIALINPYVLEAGPDAPDPIFEGCLSFFGVRGRVYRPRRLTVGHQDLDGTYLETRFTGGVAALVAHEIDHLDGRLYDTRMAPGEQLITVADYRAIKRGSYGRRPMSERDSRVLAEDLAAVGRANSSPATACPAAPCGAPSPPGWPRDRSARGRVNTEASDNRSAYPGSIVQVTLTVSPAVGGPIETSGGMPARATSC